MIPTALFVFSIVHYYREMMPVARYFHERGWRVRVIIGWQGPSAELATADCHESGLRLAPIHGSFLIAAEHEPVAVHEAPHAPARQRSIPVLRRLMMLADSMRKLRRLKACADTLLAELAPDLVFAGPYHSPDLLHNGVALTCRKRGIPYCCLPVSAYIGAYNSIEARLSNRKLGMQSAIIDVDYDLLNRLMARIFPRWVTGGDGRPRIFMWDPTLMLAAHWAGTIAGNVWQKPAESFDAVYVYSEFSRRMLAESGYDPAKIVICGIPLLDGPRRALSDNAHRSALFCELGIAQEEDFVLFNVEPSAEHRYADWPDHWRRFHALMAIMRRCGLPIVLSLHPLCKLENYEFAEAEYGVVIARGHKIFDLYPYCRFAVSFVCSTNVVAGDFEKRLVIYDWFRMTADESPRRHLFRLPNTRYAYDEAGVEREMAVAIAATDLKTTCCEMPATGACERIHADIERRFGLTASGAALAVTTHTQKERVRA